MKKLLPLLLCAALLAGCAQTYDGPTVQRSVLCRIASTYYDNSDDSTISSKTEYTYDIYGNIAQTVEYMDDEPVSKSVSRYDAAGRLLNQTDYDLTGWFPTRISTDKYTYDDQGRITSTTHRHGFETETVTYTYDDEARTQTITLPDGSVVVQYHDEQGRAVRSECTAANGDTSAEEFERREDGQWLRVRYYQNGILETIAEYTYDDQGRLLTWTETADGETHTVFRYEYGARYQIRYNEDGSKVSTSYRDDGKIQYIVHSDAHGKVTEDSYYYYTDIQVPAEEGVTP